MGMIWYNSLRQQKLTRQVISVKNMQSGMTHCDNRNSLDRLFFSKNQKLWELNLAIIQYINYCIRKKSRKQRDFLSRQVVLKTFFLSQLCLLKQILIPHYFQKLSNGVIVFQLIITGEVVFLWSIVIRRSQYLPLYRSA